MKRYKMKRFLLLMTLGVSVVSCSNSNNDFCECDYFTGDKDVSKEERNGEEIYTFKGEPLTGNYCDMIGRNGFMVESVETYDNGILINSMDYYIDGKTVIKERYKEDGKSIVITYFLTGVIKSKDFWTVDGNRISGESYWYNGNLKKKSDYVNKTYQNYNSLGELIEE